jgi:predicted Zn-dependent peptidase
VFNYNISQLENGITVITENVPHVKSFSLGFWITAGSRDETDAINGISHFIEHMVFKGTSKRTARKISDEIESVGGYINAYTSKELT